VGEAKSEGDPRMMVPIFKQGHFLIATIMAALSDEDMRQFREALLDRVVSSRATAVIIDVMAMDVLDSFATRMLREIAFMTKLRGARTVLVGVQPEVALTMVQLGLHLEGIATALDLEDGLAYLDRLHRRG
jgi:rsbT antagonist protein RsbS